MPGKAGPRPLQVVILKPRQPWLGIALFLKGTGVSLHLLVLKLRPSVSPANWDVSVQPIVLVFGFLESRTKCECVRRSLLGGAAATMVKLLAQCSCLWHILGLKGRPTLENYGYCRPVSSGPTPPKTGSAFVRRTRGSYPAGQGVPPLTLPLR